MRARDQLIGALLLGVVTYVGVFRIAQAKSDAEVGGEGVLLDPKQTEDFAALTRLQDELTAMGQGLLRDRIAALSAARELWVAPRLGAERWAAYVESLGLVRRIYIRRIALRDPVRQLYPAGAPDVPPDHLEAFAWLSLAGAMRHEIAHYDGAIEETSAYQVELAWYDEVRRSPFFVEKRDDDQKAWDWALRSAVTSARRAAQTAASGR